MKKTILLAAAILFASSGLMAQNSFKVDIAMTLIANLGIIYLIIKLFFGSFFGLSVSSFSVPVFQRWQQAFFLSRFLRAQKKTSCSRRRCFIPAAVPTWHLLSAFICIPFWRNPRSGYVTVLPAPAKVPFGRSKSPSS